MKRKLMALLLSGAMVCGALSGCGQGGAEKADTATEQSEDAGAEDAANSSEDAGESTAEATGDSAAAEEAIQARKDSGETPTVVIAYMNFAGSPAGIDRISEKLSEITEEKLGVKVELQIMDAASYSQNMNLMLASGEQVDLFNAVSVGFMPCVNKGYTLDLEEDDLIQNYGQGILNAFRTNEIDGCRVSGTLYGTPVKKDDAAGKFGISIPAALLDEIGFDYNSLYKDGEEIIYSDFDTIEDIFTKLHEAHPEKTVFYMDVSSVVSQCLAIDIPSDNFGVLLNPTESLEIEDLFESDQYKELCQRMYDWNQRGWISPDAITETNATTVQVKSGSLMAYKTATKPGIKQQESNLCGEDMIIFQLGPDFKGSSAYNTMPWCINQNTDDPVAAMQVLNLLYTDPDASTLICWGEEGVEWKETGDGHITYADGIDANNSEYFNNVNWEMPNQFIAKIWEGNELTIWDRMQEFNDNATASKAMGFTFDNSDVSAEYTALANVYSEYQSQLELGFINPEEGLPELVNRLKEAGLDDYMAAKQAALDEWAAANGVQ
ncbi:ABC transporter substrate-binding protein [Butyrivibrio sp. LC3010]|uniref:ABC transporter substrate-binding protein n=1 Tax=Butyrivibrio sp. LC3010 TaxID=1280680 RepID=UPI00040E9A2E|nr:ABC transporter substrate-binding protein [Butyrivibrio sp. LC3010]